MALDKQYHWYQADGSPCHLVKAKSRPGMRPVTISDARQLKLYPSVTSVLDILSKPQLGQWRERQVALAALTYPRKPDDVLDDEYLDKIREDAFKQVEDAADLGKKIHTALEAYFSDQPHEPDMDVYVQAVDNLFQAEGIHVLQRELRVVNKEHGYAGTTDLLIDSKRGMGIGDYKTRKSKPPQDGKTYKMTPWDGQPTQVAAYHQAHYGQIADNAAGFNLFISTTEPGRAEIAWYDAKQLREEMEMFTHLCAVWRFKNKYDPRG